MQRIRRAPLLLALLSFAPFVQAQDKNAAKDDDDLDVTMQVLDDPEPRQPNEALRIPLPKPRPAEPGKDKPPDPGGTPGADRAKDADPKKNDPKKSEGRGDSNDKRPDQDKRGDPPDDPKDRAKEAREQRNEARREEDRREHDRREHDGPPGKPPKEHPGPPRH